MSRAPASAPGGQALSETLSGAIDPMDGGVGPPMSFFSKLKARLRKSSSKLDEGVETLIAADPAPAAVESASKTVPEPNAPRPGLAARLAGAVSGRGAEHGRVLDDAMLNELEELLISADMGVETAMRVAAAMAEGRFGKRLDATEIKSALAAEVARILAPVARPLPLYGKKPQVVLVVGVNGSGKTTTIGKLASQLKGAGKSVVIAAGDTFRAAAVEQLQIWGTGPACR